MNRDSKSQPPTGDDGNGTDGNGAGARTPSTDLQPEDTGTPESGNTGRATAAETAMKQQGKTDEERRKR